MHNATNQLKLSHQAELSDVYKLYDTYNRLAIVVLQTVYTSRVLSSS